jgi:D-lactate dehydrogenase
MSAAKPTVVIYDAKPEDKAYFAGALSGFEVVCTDQGVTPETLPLAAEAQVVAVHVSSHVDAAAMAALPALKLICCRSTGFDNIDLAEAKKRGIPVVYCSTYGEHTVAEYAFALLLTLTRRLPEVMSATKSGVMTPAELTGVDIFDKTLGVVGTGRIGRHVIEIAQGFGMTVVGFDPFPNAELQAAGFKYLPLPELLATADVISLHAPATPENINMINVQTLGQMKAGSYLINTARGSLVDTPALIEALRSGRLAGVGIDVVAGEEFERLDQRFDLLHAARAGADDLRAALYLDVLEDMPNVILTAHNAYNTVGALQRIREATVQNILAWQSGAPTNLVPGQ